MRAGPERVVLKEGSGPRLICLPFAGGSARSFVRLAQNTPEDWNVTAVQPPAGFGPGAEGLDSLAYFYLDLLAGELRGPGLVLGHSLGAAVAHRMARLWSADRSRNLHLVLSAPPPAGSSDDLLGLDDRALLEEAGRRGMLPGLRVSEDFALRFLLPDLRSDLAVLSGQGWVPEPVEAPVHLLVGSDDAACPPATVSRLQEVLAPRTTRSVKGGHMYVVEQPALSARALVEVGHEAAVPPVAADPRTTAV